MRVKRSSTHPGWLQRSMIRGSMLGKTLLPGDEELGKKDDDHKFVPARRYGWPVWNHTLRWRRKRLLLVIVGVLIVCLFFGSTGEADDDLDDGQQYPLGRPVIPSTYNQYDRGRVDDDEPTGPPPGLHRPSRGKSPPHEYDGSVNFYRLAGTLRRQASHTGGYEKRNRNVLFAVSNAKSAATLFPLICGMAVASRNFVHVALLGRDNIPLDDLLEINGIDVKTCPAVWHDARPDYFEYSSDARLESSVIGAMSHINSFLHPQVVIIDDSWSEDASFVRGIRSSVQTLSKTLIEVPKDKAEDLTWITRLDTGSLRSWHKMTVDILIQVPPDSSSVLRLLKSIEGADYTGLKPPRITLELPADLDESVRQYLENFRWPPHNDGPIAASGLAIRRRIANHRATQEESAVRFLELFYPATPSKSHVLLLSAQAELSPQYFHFVTYALLEYKHSQFGQYDDEALMGLSLELPSVLLDGKTKLAPPAISDMHTDQFEQSHPTTKSAPFLWQAPNSHAAVFFGDKWAELHSFLGNRVVKQSLKSTYRPKLVSETLPAWTEYMLEFMRARSYSLLYPAITPNALVSIHNELYHIPEEFVPTPLKRAEPLVPEVVPTEPFLRAEQPPQAPKNPEPPVIPGSLPLHMALPFDGELPELPHLPQLLYDGTMVDPVNVSTIAAEYANKFREEVGGCTIPKGKHRKVLPGKTSDLFCFGDEDQADWEDDEAEADVELVGGTADAANGKFGVKIGPTHSSTASTKAGPKKTPEPLIEADDF